MPFMGTTAPAGWALCDGAPLPSTATALIALVGSNAPSLGGRFLKGAGTAVESGVEAITLKTTQSQSTKTKEHLHGVGTLKNIGVGNHAHNVQFHNNNYDGNGGTSKDGLEDDSDGVQADLKGIQSSDSGAHNHDIIGSTANSAIDTSEVRPSSYGVNYIIKL
jgi:microcystin-dependent protein